MPYLVKAATKTAGNVKVVLDNATQAIEAAELMLIDGLAGPMIEDLQGGGDAQPLEDFARAQAPQIGCPQEDGR